MTYVHLTQNFYYQLLTFSAYVWFLKTTAAETKSKGYTDCKMSGEGERGWGGGSHLMGRLPMKNGKEAGIKGKKKKKEKDP